jgi:hypothetical protein
MTKKQAKVIDPINSSPTPTDTNPTVDDDSTVDPAQLAPIEAVADKIAERAVAALQRFTTLEERQKVWTETLYKASNDALRAILVDVYALYHDMLGQTDEAKRLRSTFKEFCASRGYNFKASTHTLTKLVRAIFGGDHKRISSYSLALRAAWSYKIKPKDLGVFLGTHGIEGLRLKKGEVAVTTEGKLGAVEAALIQKNLGVIAEKKLVADLDAAAVDKFHVVLVRQQPDQSLTITALVTADAAVKATMLAYYSANRKTLENDATEVSQKSQREKQAELIAEAHAASDKMVA